MGGARALEAHRRGHAEPQKRGKNNGSSSSHGCLEQDLFAMGGVLREECTAVAFTAFVVGGFAREPLCSAALIWPGWLIHW